MRKRLGMVDLDTGELLEGGVPVWINAKPASPYAGWVTMNQEFLAEFAARKDVRGETLRVFVYLNARLDFHNLIRVHPTEIAEALSMKRPSVYRAMKQLQELGVVLRGPKEAGPCWRLNPNAGWKGKVKDLRPALTRHLQAVE